MPHAFYLRSICCNTYLIPLSLIKDGKTHFFPAIREMRMCFYLPIFHRNSCKSFYRCHIGTSCCCRMCSANIDIPCSILYRRLLNLPLPISEKTDMLHPDFHNYRQGFHTYRHLKKIHVRFSVHNNSNCPMQLSLKNLPENITNCVTTSATTMICVSEATL